VAHKMREDGQNMREYRSKTGRKPASERRGRLNASGKAHIMQVAAGRKGGLRSFGVCPAAQM
jgi:hypothetical protein